MLALLLIGISLLAGRSDASISAADMTELDRYVRIVDPVYGFTNTFKNFTTNGYSAYFYNLTSLQYLTSKLTSRSVWTHTLIYIVPDNMNSNCTDAFIWYTWGSNGNPWKPNAEDDIDLAVVSQVAMGTRCPSVAVYEIPNQQICFFDTATPYCDSEDGAIAYTFNRFLYQNRSAEWLLLFPMAKAGVRAMDAVQALAKADFGHSIKHFIVSGASKRGWTTWLVGAVDPVAGRVKAIVPVVLDALNFNSFIHRQWQSYQGFTFVLKPYWEFGLTRATSMPMFANWTREIDPFAYRHRLTMPKFSVNAAGDEFQLLDDQRHWAHDMPGEMKTILIKDADHVLVTNFGLVIKAVRAYTESVVNNLVRPSYSWAISATTGQIAVTTSVTPKKVELVYTTIATKLRDFRDIVGPGTENPCIIHVMGGCVRFLLWTSTTITGTSPTTFATNVTAPAVGWTGFYLQLEFENGPGLDDFVFASPASVLPLGYPFADCAGAGCNGTLV